MSLTYSIDEEIILRLIEPHHAAELFRVIEANRHVILPWMRWVNEVTDVQAVHELINKWLTMKTETGCMSLGIEWNGELVGAVFHLRPDVVNRVVEVGYWLAESARGRGVASRAVRKMLDITFDDLQFNRANFRIAPHNKASLALAGRLGFVREGQTRQAWKVGDEYWDAVEFGVLAYEWKGARDEDQINR